MKASVVYTANVFLSTDLLLPQLRLLLAYPTTAITAAETGASS
jgi:hypothetical protein